MTERLQKAMNEQITSELWSGNLYLSMSFYLKRQGLEGMAQCMYKQYQEAVKNATDMAHYLIGRNAIPKIDKLDVVPQSWGKAYEAFEDAYKHERHMSQITDLLVRTASEEKDNATQDFLWAFVRKQVKEEAYLLNMVEKMKKADATGVLLIDAQLNK